MQTTLPPLLTALASLALCAAVWWKTEPDDHGEAEAYATAAALAGPSGLVWQPAHADHLALTAAVPEGAVASGRLPLESEAVDRLVIVGAPAQRDDATTRFLTARGRTLYDSDAAGHSDDAHWWVRLVQPSDLDRTVYDLQAMLALASVSIAWDDGRVEDCPWNGERFSCAVAPWVWVGPSAEMIAGQPHRCIWSHPVDDGVVRISFTGVSDATHVVGWFALNDYAAAVSDAARATLRLVVGEREQEFSVHRQRGRRAVEFRMPSETADILTIEIDAAQAGVRHMCWSLRAVQRAEVGR